MFRAVSCEVVTCSEVFIVLEFGLAVLKADLKAALDKEVKSMDEESWKFDGPRSRINLLSKPG